MFTLLASTAYVLTHIRHNDIDSQGGVYKEQEVNHLCTYIHNTTFNNRNMR